MPRYVYTGPVYYYEEGLEGVEILHYETQLYMKAPNKDIAIRVFRYFGLIEADEKSVKNHDMQRAARTRLGNKLLDPL